MKFKTLETKRLKLRAFTQADATLVAKYAGDKDVALMTTNIPYPYELSMAEEWIATHQQRIERNDAAIYAITLKTSGELIGAVELSLELKQQRGCLGYWIAKQYWGKGYATEAVEAIIDFGFNHLKLNRIYAEHISRNPASGKVMRKLGMKKEGALSEHAVRAGITSDLEIYGILKSDKVQT